MKPSALSAVLLLTPLAALCAASAPQFAARPNVLFIAIDDLRTSLGCYGDTLAKSPNMDRLAQTSRLFLGAYTHQAVCGPARTAILTGRLPDNTRVWHNRNLFRETLPNLVTLPQLFKNNGYQALSFGKVFSGAETELDPQSWSAPEVLRGGGWKNYALPGAKAEGKGAAYEAADVPDDGYPDGKLANLAIATLEKLKQQNQPFFLAAGFFKPHLPFNAPKKYWDLYDPAVFALQEGQTRVKGAPEIAYHTHRELGGYKDMPEDERVSAGQARTLRHGYYACVSYVDAQVGKVLDALQRLSLDQNTIVVLWGDHGWSLGEKDRWCKGTNFERDTRVPLLIRAPGMAKPGATTGALIEYVDIYPTLAALAGLTPPTDLDGRSFVPVLQDPGTPGRDVAFSQFNRPWKPTGFESMGYTLRDATQRYTRWVEWPSRKTVSEELYDYAAPASATRDGAFFIEQQNIAAAPAYAGELSRMRSKLDEVLATRIRLQPSETGASSELQPKKKKKKKNQ
jgi:iduronate 2-sulfatase